MSLIHGDCLEVMAGMEPESVDAVVTDPPYGLEFMGKEWDKFDRRPTGGFRSGSNPDWVAGRVGPSYQAGAPAQAFHARWAEAAYRVAKPSAYLLAFGGTRTVHRMTVALEDAGWIIRDMLVWAYACLSDDTEILTEEGWVRYNRPNVGQLAAAFDPRSGELRWERIEAVHRYHHEGIMAAVGPSVVTLNHRVILDQATASVPRLSGVWNDLHPPVGVGQEGERVVLLEPVQREGADPRRADRAGHVVAGATTTAVRGDDRASQSGLEGRRYDVQEAWELLGRPLRAEPGVGAPDGPQGRLRDGAPAGDRRGLWLPADQDGGREPREPRSDGQPAREPDALAGQPDAQALRMGQVPDRDGGPDAVRLGDYAGTVWCITVPSGAFLARRNGVVFVTGNSGFPKSKASLKPAWEPIVMARKPGPLRMLAIDECRIPTEDSWSYDADRNGTTFHGEQGARIKQSAAKRGAETVDSNPAGRWPANVILTDPIFDGGIEGVVGGGEQSGGGNPAWRSDEAAAKSYGGFETGTGGYHTGLTPTDTSGTYSRFFLIPKADRGDREPVLGGLPEGTEPVGAPGATTQCRNCGSARLGDGGIHICRPDCPGKDLALVPSPTRRARMNGHPTVKPTDLMRHLVRLVTPTGGVVLDPFGGSGTTALACELEGFPWVLIEREEEYVRIAEARLNGTQRGLGLDVPAPTPKGPTRKDGVIGGNKLGAHFGQFRAEPREEPA